jgi:hypothetical protein
VTGDGSGNLTNEICRKKKGVLQNDNDVERSTGVIM